MTAPQYVTCPTCGDFLTFGRDILYGRTTQTCKCGSRPLPVIRSAEPPQHTAPHARKVAYTCVYCGKAGIGRADRKYCDQRCTRLDLKGKPQHRR